LTEANATGDHPPWSPVAPKLLVAGSVGLAAAGATVLFLFDPSTAAFYPPCPFHALTGLWCPGCGTTRALHELLCGDIAAAFGLNPLMVLMLPYLGYSALSYAALGLRGRLLPEVLVSRLWAWLALGVILAYWVLRNLPLYPFSLLAP
jgi:hypothetical protein